MDINYQILSGDVSKEMGFRLEVSASEGIDIGGIRYKMIGTSEQIEAAQRILKLTPTSTFTSMDSFKAALSINPSAVRTSEVAAAVLGDSSSVDWLTKENASLAISRNLISRACFEKYTKIPAPDPESLRHYLTSVVVDEGFVTDPAVFVERFNKALKDKNLKDFSALFSPLNLGDLQMIDHEENLNLLSPAPVSKAPVYITEADCIHLKKYMDDVGFSGVVALMDSRTSAPILIKSRQFETLEGELPFCVHSISKVHTGVLAIEMIKRGILPKEALREPLKLDSAVMAVLPPSVQRQLAKTTMLDVMLHRANLGDYKKKYEEFVKQQLALGRDPIAITRTEYLLAFADAQITENNYSNLGILLVGLSLQYHYTSRVMEEGETPLTFDQILKKLVLDPSGTHLSQSMPSRGRYNEADKVTPHLVGTPAGGGWTTMEDLAKFGKWFTDKYRSDRALATLTDEFGGEFFSAKERELFHVGAIDSSSAGISSFVDNGVTMALASDIPNLAVVRIYNAIRENILS